MMRKIFLASCMALLFCACSGLNTAHHSSEWYQAALMCIEFESKFGKFKDKEKEQLFNQRWHELCQEAIQDKDLPSVDECNEDECNLIGQVYLMFPRIAFSATSKSSILYYKKSFSYLNRGCQLDNAEACYLLSLFYSVKPNTLIFGLPIFSRVAYIFTDEVNKIVKNDKLKKKKYQNKSHNLLKEQCHFNNAKSCFQLGVFSIIRTDDYFVAKQSFEKSCNLDEAEGCGALGDMYAEGLGTRKNLKTAKEYYGRACDLGSQRGCDNHNAIKERDIILSR